MSVLTKATRRNIPEEAILHRDRRENLKSYRNGSLQWYHCRRPPALQWVGYTAPEPSNSSIHFLFFLLLLFISTSHKHLQFHLPSTIYNQHKNKSLMRNNFGILLPDFKIRMNPNIISPWLVRLTKLCPQTHVQLIPLQTLSCQCQCTGCLMLWST
jgi:hypothetical protein